MIGRKRRREVLRGRPFPEDWSRRLHDMVPLVRRLPREDLRELRGWIHILLAEKRFEGVGGIEPTDEMRLVIAAQASLLLLHREGDVFARLRSIVIYPTEYHVVEEVETEDGLVETVDETRAGESWSSGALVLGWDEVVADLNEDSLQNVVLHEFAHQLDAESGSLNGAPRLGNRAFSERWATVLGEAYQRLGEASVRQADAVLDSYGAEDPAEFFAVAVEAFFLDPVALRTFEPELYEVLAFYFRQDPMAWPG